VLVEPSFKSSQLPGQDRLAGVGFDLSGGDQSRVAGAESFGHQG
jgi:hypothetical protein